MKEWLAKVEQRNIPHFARGVVFGLIFWILGIKLGWINPVFFSFVAMFAFSAGWEVYDQIRMVRQGIQVSDGFDWMDILCDMLGCGFVQLVHVSVHYFDS